MFSKAMTRRATLFSISAVLAIVAGVTAFVLLTGDRERRTCETSLP